jgi:integron integrase
VLTKKYFLWYDGTEVKMSRLLERVTEKAALQHKSRSTAKSYREWAKRYIVHFYDDGVYRHPDKMGSAEVEAFLTGLALDGASPSTQNQALCALVFLYRDVLGKPLGNVRPMRARRQKRQPEALTRDEITRVFEHLRGDRLLVCQLLYGSGLRLMEALRLRVKDLDLDNATLTARNTKSRRDRVVPVAARMLDGLRVQLERVREMWHSDLATGYAGASFPQALERKYTNAARLFAWQFVFPASRRTHWSDGTMRRHHLHESAPPKALKRAAEKAGIVSRVHAHALRHSFATHFLQDGGDIRTLQQLLGHKDIRTTMVYLHVDDAAKAQSPLDKLEWRCNT